MADFQKELASGDEEALLRAARALFGNNVQRFIYGTVRIDSVSAEEGGIWTAELSGRISAWDFRSNSPIMSAEVNHTAAGASEWAAIDNARKFLAGNLLVSELVYGL